MLKVFFLFFSISLIYAQPDKKGIKVVYDYSNDFINTKEVLFATSEYALYTINPKDNSWDGSHLGQVSSQTNNGFVGVIEAMQVEIYLSSKDDLVTMNTVTDDRKRHLVKDSTITFNWKLFAGDEKMISGYKCYKAGLTWRGRSYTAYYTPDIPLPFGPYKFKGLPGLILSLETSSHNQLHQWRATVVKSPYIVKNDLALKASDLKGKRITMFDLIKLQDELIRKDIQVQRARLNQNTLLTKVVHERNSVEKIYEWEKGRKNKTEYFKDKSQ
jgi:GLPGLI family protein